MPSQRDEDKFIDDVEEKVMTANMRPLVRNCCTPLPRSEGQRSREKDHASSNASGERRGDIRNLNEPPAAPRRGPAPGARDAYGTNNDERDVGDDQRLHLGRRQP